MPDSASSRRLTNAPRPTAACASLRSTACCNRCASVPAAVFFERRFDGAGAEGLHEPARRHARPPGRPARRATAACGCRSSATTAPPPPRPRSLRCAIIARSTPASAIASASPAGASRPARKSPPAKTAIPGPPPPSCWMSTAPSRPPSAVIRPTGSGSITGGSPAATRKAGSKSPASNADTAQPAVGRREDGGWTDRRAAACPDRSSATPLLDPPARILVRGVNWLGDAVMTTPALQRLRERFPEARITLADAREAGRTFGSITRALTASLSSPPARTRGPIARRLRAEHFDIALVLPNSPRSALEAWLAGIPAAHWLCPTLAQLVPHPNRPNPARPRSCASFRLPKSTA